MKGISHQFEGLHVSISHGLSFLIMVLIKDATDFQTGISLCCFNEVDNRDQIPQRFSTPIDAHKGKQTVTAVGNWVSPVSPLRSVRARECIRLLLQVKPQVVGLDIFTVAN